MQMIVYPGNANQPCQAEYGIAITRDASTTRADIVVIDSHKADFHHTALIHHQCSRDHVLNKILSVDLMGIRVDLLRFFVIADAESSDGMIGYEYPIKLDFEDYQRKGNPVQVRGVAPTSLKGWLRYALGFYVKTVTALNRDVVGGRVTVKTERDQVRQLPAAESKSLLAAVGYQPQWAYSGLRIVSST
jgi:hypothetical protein